MLVPFMIFLMILSPVLIPTAVTIGQLNDLESASVTTHPTEPLAKKRR